MPVNSGLWGGWELGGGSGGGGGGGTGSRGREAPRDAGELVVGGKEGASWRAGRGEAASVRAGQGEAVRAEASVKAGRGEVARTMVIPGLARFPYPVSPPPSSPGGHP